MLNKFYPKNFTLLLAIITNLSLSAQNYSITFSGTGGDTWAGIFEDFGQSAYFWTSTWSYGYLPWVYALNYSLPQIGRSLYVRENGFSVRCIKD